MRFKVVRCRAVLKPMTCERSDLITLNRISICKFKDFLQFRCAKRKNFKHKSYILHS